MFGEEIKVAKPFNLRLPVSTHAHFPATRQMALHARAGASSHAKVKVLKAAHGKFHSESLASSMRASHEISRYIGIDLGGLS